MSQETAAEFLAWIQTLGPHDTWTSAQRMERKRRFRAMSTDERYLIHRGHIDDVFVDANRSERPPQEVMSPSGRYKLVITGYIRPGGWGYSRGEVFRIADGVRVADVKRNYGMFPFLFMEDHVDGHDYLVCGEDYQGSTFCQLDTGKVKSFIPDEAFEGFGFCWGHYERVGDGSILLVVGCYWAAPDEIRLHDISSPMEGWPSFQVQREDGSLQDARFNEPNTRFSFEDDRVIWLEGDLVYPETGETQNQMRARHAEADRAYDKAKETGAPPEEVARLKALYDEMVDRDPDTEPEDEEEMKPWSFVPFRRVTFQRQLGCFLKKIDEWTSEARLEAEALDKARREEEEARRAQWLVDDPLYVSLSAVADLKPLTHFGYPSFKQREIEGDSNPGYIVLRGRIYDPDKDHNHSASLKWGVTSGDITLETHVRRQRPEQRSFPRSIQGIHDAWTAAQAHLASEEGAT